MSFDKVAAEHFYKDNGDKIKQNWFLYEYSNILFEKPVSLSFVEYTKPLKNLNKMAAMKRPFLV